MSASDVERASALVLQLEDLEYLARRLGWADASEWLDCRVRQMGGRPKPPDPDQPRARPADPEPDIDLGIRDRWWRRRPR